jgi:hypothetical protein|tara:strand:- start:7080 stop:7274 length:195 start_codon:yes stop_codon:yes gene_type:complete
MNNADRTWTWLSMGFAALAMLTSLFALATDPSFTKQSEVDYLDENLPEEVLDEMRGLGMSTVDN